MFIIYFILLISLGVKVILCIEVIKEIRYNNRLLGYFNEQYFTDVEYECGQGDEDDLNTLINESVLEREKLFDNRIERLKAELEVDTKSSEIEQLKKHLRVQLDMFNGTHGEILEEGIYNIPHHQVIEKEELEIAD